MRAAGMLSVLVGVAAAVVFVAAAAAPADAQQPSAPVKGGPARSFVRIPAGEYVPFYGDGSPVAIAAFELQRDLVSVRDYRLFLQNAPQWRADRLSAAFADAGYLRGFAEAGDDEPVVNISWFAARAYCRSIGGRLPTIDEWEYVGSASETQRDAAGDAARRTELLERYMSPRDRQPAGISRSNWYGVRDMHGAVREWVLDFNSIMVTDDSRSSRGMDRGLYCAAAAAATRDPSDYAAYLRYALRASLSARSTVSNVGFRCAR